MGDNHVFKNIYLEVVLQAAYNAKLDEYCSKDVDLGSL